MRHFALSLALFVALAAPARSGVNQWTYIGPPDGLGAAGPIVADPNAAGTIYVGYVGVRKTTDGGTTWEPTGPGLPSGYVGTLLMDSSRPSTLYALDNYSSGQSGVFRTRDAGANWLSVNKSPLDSSVSALAIDPTLPLTLFATTTSGIYRTTDGGETWARQGPSPQGETVTRIVIDPRDSLTMYATTEFKLSGNFYGNGALYRSHDAGRSWSRLDGAGSGQIGALAIDPFDTSVLYIGSNYHGPEGYSAGLVTKSSDSGLNWSFLFLAEFIVGIAIAPASPEAIYVTASGHTGVGIGVHRSTDGGRTWAETDGGLTDRRVGPPAVHPSTPNRVFVGNSQGVFEATFQPADAACSPDPATLCLRDERFRIDAQWSHYDGFRTAGGSGTAAPITNTTGAFWFFDPTNLELVVKVLDGRSVNGKFWVFYGSLTNVEFTLAVTDTETGATKTYFNSQGQLASVADTSAF